VMRTLLTSPEFRSRAALTAKFKTPYQYVVSVARAADVPIANVRPLLGTLTQLGMPLYGCQTPDGYKNTEAAWLNPEGMTRRINFATAFASGRLPLAQAIPEDQAYQGMGKAALDRAASPVARRGASADASQGAATGMQGSGGSPAPAVAINGAPIEADQLMVAVGDGLSSKTRRIITDAPPNLRAALILGSPDFMRR
jgi:uncharacterized protein (DUF1800 family)